MTTYDAIRHLLRQARDEADGQLRAGTLSARDTEVLRAFHRDLDRLVIRMDPTRPPVAGAPPLGRDLFALLGRCQGPLEPYRQFLEDALSATGTETG